jgi:hypothetical protein
MANRERAVRGAAQPRHFGKELSGDRASQLKIIRAAGPEKQRCPKHESRGENQNRKENECVEFGYRKPSTPPNRQRKPLMSACVASDRVRSNRFCLQWPLRIPKENGPQRYGRRYGRIPMRTFLYVPVEEYRARAEILGANFLPGICGSES